MYKVISIRNLFSKYMGPACRVLLFFCVLNTALAGYLNDTLKYKVLGKEWISRPIIVKSLKDRCLKVEEEIEYGLDCRHLSRSFYESLDIKSFSGEGMDGIDVTGTTVVFYNRLIELMQFDGVEYLLKSIGEQLETYPNGFDLYSITLRATGGNEKLSLEILATLFQDMSPSVSHLHFLASHYRENGMSDQEERNFELLKSTHQEFFQIADLIRFKELKREDFKLYPTTGSKNERRLTFQFYHYYVMANSTLEMEKAGFSKEEAILMPLLLNLVYQTVQHRGLLEGIKWPNFLNEKAIRSKMYTTYYGSTYALGEEPIDSTVFQNFLQLRPLELLGSIVLTTANRK